MRTLIQRGALLVSAVLGLAATPVAAHAQKALVYCPVNVDATGCNAIVTALTGPAYPLGVDRGYDGTNGTVDLKTVDLFTYSVFVVPSLADDGSAQPYAKLRDPEVVEHLKAALIGRLALWSGSPDQGATNRGLKDALIQNLAGYAGGAFATAKGPGLVALLDASASASARYDWLRAITPVPVTADANLLIYGSVRTLNSTGSGILTYAGGTIAYDNMATYGFMLPNGAAGVSLDAVGQTGTSTGGQVVLVTVEAGNASSAVVRTDKDDYAPGTTVVITGSGWEPGETVKLTLHEDPMVHEDRVLTAVADGSGSFTNTEFAPEEHHLGVRFVLTAVGETSGKRAQTTFTDGNATVTGTVKSAAPGNPPIAGAIVSCSVADGCNNFVADTTDAAGAYTLDVNFQGSSISNLPIRVSANGFAPASAPVSFSKNNEVVTLNFTLTPAASAPVASNDTYSTSEDTQLSVPAPGVLANDGGTSPVTATLVTGPAPSGTLNLNPDGSFVFTPAANFVGQVTFSYSAQNSAGSSNATVTIDVTPVNDAPVTGNDTYSTNEDTPLTIAAPGVLTNDTDPDGGSLTAILVNGPATSEGTLTLNANGSFTFSPALNFHGTASFTYKANDGTADSPPATVTITVSPVNDAPFADAQNVTTNEDQPANITLTGSDLDGDGLTYIVVTQPAHGTLTGTGPNVTYTPAENYNGPDQFTFKVSDGTVESGVVTVSITVVPQNDAPVAANDSYTTAEDAPLTVNAPGVLGNDTDIDAGSLTAVVVAGPAAAEGTLNLNANGSFTFTPAANFHGTATFTYQASDGSAASNTATVTITVTPVNDVPVAVADAYTATEDAALNVPAATGVLSNDTDADGQTLTAVLVSQPAAGQGSVTLNGDGSFTYTPAADFFGATSFTYKASDGSADSPTVTVSITVNAVNDAPSFTKGADQTVGEDAGAQSVANWATAISAGPNESGQVLSFEIVGNDNPTLFSAAPTVSATGTLTYTPTANRSGIATIQIRLKDDGGTANGGVDASATESFKITVTPVNDAPSFTKGADQTVNEDAGAQTVNGWATNPSEGADDEEGQALTFLVTNDNNALFSTQPSLDAMGNLTYTPAADAFGSATVTVVLKDDGGTANGGVDTSAPQTFTITVNAVNDAPSFTKGADQAVNEDSGPHSVAGWATGVNAGPTNENTQTVSFEITANSNSSLFASGPAVASDGTLTYTLAPNANGSATITLNAKDNGGTANGGDDTSDSQTFTITVTAVNDAPSFTKGADQTVNEDAGPQTANGWATAISAGPSDESAQAVAFTVTNGDNALFSAQPAIDAAGNLTYTPAANAFGSTTVTVTATDNGGTANGGTDTSAPQTFTITIHAVNDAPSFMKGADQSVNEDSGPQTVGGWATQISSGPSNESGQAVSFEITGNSDAGLFEVAPAIAPNGTLTYTPAANAFGTATITIQVKDDGGTANNGDDTSDPQTFTITVNAVNDAPTFGLIPSAAAFEDAGPQAVPSALTAPTVGPANENTQTLSLSVTNDNNTLFAVQPAIDLGTGTLTYTPAPHANGSAIVTVVLSDNGGTANGGVDATTKTLTITVTAVNDVPSFTKGADQATLEDGGAQTVSGWATTISAGPADESGQTLSFLVSNNNNALFVAQPAVDASGNLTYTAAPNANGSATVTLKLQDNGGTANGGVDTSADQTFTITIKPVNDVPSFTKGDDQTVLEDSGPKSVTGWATAISKGPADESVQVVDFIVTNDNNALFSAQPVVAADGSLTFTPAANSYGSATVTVAIHDNGGTDDGGDDTSDPQTFTITVTPVNDVPSFTAGDPQTVLEDAGAQTVAAWATAISAGPNEASQQVEFEITNNTNTALFSAQPAVAANGQLTFTPAQNEFGVATITLRIKDNGGTDNGGVDVSATQNFTITVTPVNDAPDFDVTAPPAVDEDADAQTVTGVVTNRVAGPANENGQALTLSVTSTNPSLFETAPAIDNAGTLTYKPNLNANGTSTVTVTLKDNGGTSNGGVDETSTTFLITVNAVNDAPTIDAFGATVAPTPLGTAVSANMTFTDVDLGDSPSDQLTATIDWGDGTTPYTQVYQNAPTTRTISNVPHTYAATGVYTITFTVTDRTGATDTEVFKYVVIYDPTGGFVTGGGWIISPAGAYVADPSLSGKATFGFVSKYQKGAKVPSGNTEFQFHAGNLNFKSTVYEWLVVSGARAQYKGTGTINGSGTYGFLLTSTDGQAQGGGGSDKFRIKIWNTVTGAIVYDNQASADDANLDAGTNLGGGSIVIHSK